MTRLLGTLQVAVSRMAGQEHALGHIAHESHDLLQTSTHNTTTHSPSAFGQQQLWGHLAKRGLRSGQSHRFMHDWIPSASSLQLLIYQPLIRAAHCLIVEQTQGFVIQLPLSPVG